MLTRANKLESKNMSKLPNNRPRVVIVGGGFGGLNAAKALRDTPVQITLIDRANYHLFQPLLYQVATASLSAEQITAPIRGILDTQKNVEVLMSSVDGIDTNSNVVNTEAGNIGYDYLILATGATYSYFGHDEWNEYAYGLKTIQDALTVRSRILAAYEYAELAATEEERSAWLTFVIVGGGPTGVEMSGQIAEMARTTLKGNFKNFDPAKTRVMIVEAGSRILSSFHTSLSEKASKYLQEFGVEIRNNTPVTNVDAFGVTVSEGKRIASRTVIWAAGNSASAAGKWIGAEMDKAGRVKITSSLTAPGHDNIYVIGDTAALDQDGKQLPGVAQVAMQMGVYSARCIQAAVNNQNPLPPFRYFNKGDMATVGRRFAIYDIEKLETPSGTKISGPIRLAGVTAWLMWLTIHIAFLIDYANRIFVMLSWMNSYFTNQRSARLIPSHVTEESLPKQNSNNKANSE